MSDGLVGEAGPDCQPAGSKRRRWSLAEKLAVVGEACSPATNASAVARRHGIKPAQLYRWKRSLASMTDLASDRQIRDHTMPLVHMGLGSEGAVLGSIIEVQLVNGRSLRVHGAIDANTLCQLVAALES